MIESNLVFACSGGKIRSQLAFEMYPQSSYLRGGTTQFARELLDIPPLRRTAFLQRIFGDRTVILIHDEYETELHLDQATNFVKECLGEANVCYYQIPLSQLPLIAARFLGKPEI